MLYRTLVTSVCLQAAFVLSSFAGSALQGEVRGADGRPLSGAQIRIDRKDKNSPSIVSITDAKGHYATNNLAIGLYRISVVTDGTVKSYVDVRTASNDARVDFDMKPTSTKKVKHYILSPDSTGTHLGTRWVEVFDEGTVAGTYNVGRYSGELAREINRRQTNNLQGR